MGVVMKLEFRLVMGEEEWVLCLLLASWYCVCIGRSYGPPVVLEESEVDDWNRVFGAKEWQDFGMCCFYSSSHGQAVVGIGWTCHYSPGSESLFL